MPSIEKLGYPLVYKAKNAVTWFETLSHDTINLRTEVRALEGMQKEALVYDAPTKTVWRMVSDEGPYLNGTDLAPFPLAFYTAGMAFSFVTELLQHAKQDNIIIQHVELTQDNFYTMEGSALRGDMIGGALPAKLAVTIHAAASNEQIQNLVNTAVKSSPAQAYNGNPLNNVFSLTLNNNAVDVVRVTASNKPKNDPLENFRQSLPLTKNPRTDIITKLASAETLFNVEGGAGSSLKSEQKRTLHVRGVVTVQEDGLLVCDVQLFKPIGSTFRFLCDYQYGDTAPPPLAYLSAGVGFCFMTQVGRYATIVKQNLKAYRIVQDNAFTVQDGKAIAHPIDTHLFVEMEEANEAAHTLLSMSEQTCFLHAAMRGEVPSQVQITSAEAME
jgi:uncharacterized OsmC-like protein